MDRPRAITVDRLTKFFPAPWTWSRLMRPWQPVEPTRALWEFALSVAQGELVVLVGPNGSGKTTLLKILSSLILPTSGSVRVLGMDPARQADEVKAQVGLITGDERSFYWRLSATENLRFFATLYGLRGEAARARVAWLLDLLEVEGPDRRVQVLSAGMRQRLAIARGLLADPPVLLLDEPTRHLDPPTTRRVQAFIRHELVERQGKTVLYATHSVHEAASLADRVAVLHAGRLAAVGTLPDLAKTVGHSGSDVETLYALLAKDGHPGQKAPIAEDSPSRTGEEVS
ncbi:ABC transporter ATP-binding protein [Nitrospinae bacterium AH_259_B05_G02_I21]|nr:ABC transporter ATP-binding protein [Nitrospinae bacterium AH_259_B05_G02_I21]